jgi:FkbM family methyltransferase
MRMNNAKAVAKSLIGMLGYDIRQLPTGPAYPSQCALLSGLDVPVIFDCGANEGNTVARYRRLFPTAQIDAFEPLPQCVADLQSRFAEDPLTRVHRYAVTDHAGSVEFHSHSWATFSSTLTPADSLQRHSPDVPTDSVRIEVDSITVDDFCRDENIDHVSILKMDIQGGELAALHGSTGMLAATAIDLIYTEVSFLRLYEGQGYFEDVLAFLRGYGYALYGLFDLVRADGGFLSQADALFVNPQIEGRSGPGGFRSRRRHHLSASI